MAADQTCRAEYPPGPNPMPNTRIVRCGKPAGHPERLHAEALEDGEFGPEWAADETPAQPTCVGCGRPYPALDKAHGYEQCGECAAAAIAQPHVAPAPDSANTGGAGADVYREAAQAMLAHQFGDEERTLEWRHCGGCVHAPNTSCVCPDEPYPSMAVRAAIDAGRAPLLAEVERLTREVAEYELNIEDQNTKTIREIRRLGRDLAEAIRERDEARAEVARLGRVSDLNPFGSELGDACCVDAAGSTPDEVLHTSGCRNRCSVHTPTPPHNKIRAYPCALTVGHAEGHWIHPTYREPVGSGT